MVSRKLENGEHTAPASGPKTHASGVRRAVTFDPPSPSAPPASLPPASSPTLTPTSISSAPSYPAPHVAPQISYTRELAQRHQRDDTMLRGFLLGLGVGLAVFGALVVVAWLAFRH